MCIRDRDLFPLPILGKYPVTEHLHTVDLLRGGGDITALDDGVIRSVGVGAGIECCELQVGLNVNLTAGGGRAYYLRQARWGRKIASLRTVTGILC